MASRLIQQSVFKNILKNNNNILRSSLQCSNIQIFRANNSVRYTSTKVDEVPLHEVNRWEGSWHWIIERSLSVALVPMLGVSAIYGGHPANDFLLGFVVPLHTHIGLQAVVQDYLPARRTPIIYKIVNGIVYLLTGGAIYGCYLINTEDVGLTEYFKKLWKGKEQIQN